MDLDEWTAEDKALHFAGGAVAGAISQQAIEYLWPDMHPLAQQVVALIPVIVLGVGKEIYDHQHQDDHTSDWKDAAATVAGGALAITITCRF